MVSTSLSSLIQTCRRRVLDLALRQGQPIIIVDSPPGAGKTALTLDIAAVAVGALNLRVAIIAPRSEQTYDVARRLVGGYQLPPPQFLQSDDRPLPPDLRQLVPPPISRGGALPRGSCVIIANVTKFMISVPDLASAPFDLVICDEAYQVTYGELAPVFAVARQLVMIGDPGQLPPVVTVDTARFEVARIHVHWPAPEEHLHRWPTTPVVQLPATQRFPQDTVDIIQPAFYPNLPFQSAVNPANCHLTFTASGSGDGIDQALDAIAAGASFVGIVAPDASTSLPDVDDDLAETIARIAERIVQRGAVRPGGSLIQPADIGCVDPHVASEAAIRSHLLRRGLVDTVVQTPEVWQGLERDIMIATHPLSGRIRFSTFDLDPGRLSVMLSRHRRACIVVGRVGIAQALETHQHDIGERPRGAANKQWYGWQAHCHVWRQLDGLGRLFPL